ncbi:Aminopyrimidine aminohydrolase [Aphelenchoides fujianensis]|nr:Aminopyrimidine aminohydrolase [Aphelenchoides fujianensis]
MKAAKFTNEAWNRNKKLFDSTAAHPFNRELLDGTLEEEKFRFYCMQDSKFLGEYAKVFASAASRSKNPAQVAYLAKRAVDLAISKDSFHSQFFKDYSIDLDEFKETEMTPTCHHYASFLHSTAQTGSVAVQLAALLPRALVHHKIGQKAKADAQEDNPFYAWIEENGGEERAEIVGKMLVLVDELAAKETREGVEQMQTAYETAARLGVDVLGRRLS